MSKKLKSVGSSLAELKSVGEFPIPASPVHVPEAVAATATVKPKRKKSAATIEGDSYLDTLVWRLAACRDTIEYESKSVLPTVDVDFMSSLRAKEHKLLVEIAACEQPAEPTAEQLAIFKDASKATDNKIWDASAKPLHNVCKAEVSISPQALAAITAAAATSAAVTFFTAPVLAAAGASVLVTAGVSMLAGYGIGSAVGLVRHQLFGNKVAGVNEAVDGVRQSIWSKTVKQTSSVETVPAAT